MKFWEASHTFSHPWSTVSQAFWRKYPNEFQNHLYGTDVLSRCVSSDGKLHSTRLIISDWGIPGWMRIFMPSARAYAVEHSVVDPVNKTLTLKSHNLNASSIMSFQENVTYSAVQEDSTKLHHIVEVSCSASRMLDEIAEGWILDTVGKNAKYGLKAMDCIIDKVESEARSAFRAVDDFTTDTMRSVDQFTTDVAKSVDEFTSDAKRSLDVLMTEVDELTADAKKSIGDLTNDAADILNNDSSPIVR